MNKEDLYPLIGKYLNGYKIIKIEEDPFVKGQINLWTDGWITGCFGDKSIVKFFIRPESNSSAIYRELIDKENKQLKDNWNKLKEYIKEAKLEEFEKTYGKRYGKTFTQAEIIVCNMILDKMQKLEHGSESNGQ